MFVIENAKQSRSLQIIFGRIELKQFIINRHCTEDKVIKVTERGTDFKREYFTEDFDSIHIKFRDVRSNEEDLRYIKAHKPFRIDIVHNSCD